MDWDNLRYFLELARTGTLAAVVLAALRVPRETIVADYAASNQRLPQILGRLGEVYTAGVDQDLQLSAQSTPPQVMRLVLDQLSAPNSIWVGSTQAAARVKALSGVTELIAASRQSWNWSTPGHQSEPANTEPPR